MRALTIKVKEGKTYSAYINIMIGDVVLFAIPEYNWSHIVRTQADEEEMLDDLEAALRPVVGEDADILAALLQRGIALTDVDIANWMAKHTDVRFHTYFALKQEALFMERRGMNEKADTLYQLAQILHDV